jgi:RNA polymerase sigma factor (sigma-70 family)
MDAHDLLAQEFEAHRTHLRAVAYRMLGSRSEADDAVQEAWLRLSRADAGGIENLGGWLTTVVARVCLDLLRSRKSRDEVPLEPHDPEPTSREPGGAEREALLAESVGLALLVVLETLTPAERVAFVLHDMFDLSFDEIAPIVGRSSAAARQLASRARRRVKGAAVPDADRTRQREIVDAFLAASPAGTSSPCSRCSIPTWCCVPMPLPSTLGARARFVARLPWRGHSPDARASRSGRWSTAPWDSCGHRVAGRGSCSASRSQVGRSSRST